MRSGTFAGLVAASLLALGGGCSPPLLAFTGGRASPQKIEQGALRHEAKARQWESEGKYAKAASEREAAQKQWNKAAARRRSM